ncbi:hypothetical protein ACTXGQ_15210 [Marinobacter sp. 1Y8]
MIKRVVLALTILFLLVSYLVYRSLEALDAPPKFTVINSTSSSVNITATWRDSKIAVNNLIGIMTFTVQSEAAMLFTIEYESGKTEEKSIGYFTSGGNYKININENGVIVSGN